MEKVCTKCGVSKDLGDYCNHSRGKYGKQPRCKSCNAEASKEYRSENKLKVSEYNRKYREANKEKLIEVAREWREANKERAQKSRRKNYELNIEREKDYRRKYYEVNKERLNKYSYDWFRANREHRNEYIRNKRGCDINYRLIGNLRSRVYNALKGFGKDASTVTLTGCSVNELKKHLEQQFTEGMTWDNYGEWHVDHMRPCASFDLSVIEQQRECFHYTNLQPLWAGDNLKKADTWARCI